MSIVDGLVSATEQVVDALGYVGLAAVMLVENVLPIPSEVVLPLVGVRTADGSLLFWAAALAATVGSVLGSWGLYLLGRAGGRPLVLRLPRVLGITGPRLARAEAWFARRGDLVVLFGRLVPGVRVLVSVPAGTLRMPVGRFLLLTTLGAAAWNTAFLWLGVALADRWESVVGVLETATPAALAAAAGAVVLVLVLVVRRLRALRVRP
ncbi:DedA family protein [Geodermatophilus sp. SYSU D00691]